MTQEMVLFESGDGKVSLPVPMDGNTVWLTQAQMVLLFGKDVSVVNRHIKNAISDGEIEFSSQYAKNANCGERIVFGNVRARRTEDWPAWLEQPPYADDPLVDF